MKLEDCYICKYVPIHSTGNGLKRSQIFSFLNIFSYAFTASNIFMHMYVWKLFTDLYLLSISGTLLGDNYLSKGNYI